MNEFLERLAQQIRIVREHRQLSQADLAKAAGTSPSLISYLEGGQRAPSLETLWNIAQALEQPLWLLIFNCQTTAQEVFNNDPQS